MNVHVFPGRLDENVDDGSGIRPIFPKEVHTVLNVEVGDSASYDSLEILCVREKKHVTAIFEAPPVSIRP